jgi:hypothetical protein
MINFKKYLFDLIFLSLVLVFVFKLSSIYSEYYSDLHHWGFIAQNSLDYINGRLLFKEVYVHHGIGNFIVYDLINYFYKINFTSIGLITCIFYYLNLIILYLIIKKVLNSYAAIITISLIFFVHPFILYPWSDYMAGLSLSIFFYLTLFNRNLFLICGFFLFLSVIFRSTYIVNIMISVVFYFSYACFNKKLYNDDLVKILLSFFFFLIIFFFILFFQKNLSLWFDQSILQIKTYASLSQDPAFGFSDKFSDKVTKYVYVNFGDNSFVIFQLLKFTIKFIINIFSPKTIEDFFFFIFYVVNFIFFLLIIKNSKKLFLLASDSSTGILFFFALLGFFGVIQSLYAFTFFRNFNASSSIFLVNAFLFKNFLRKRFLENTKIYSFFIIFTLSFFFYKFLDASKSMFNINKVLFTTSSIKYFGDRKFLKEDFEYYNLLQSILCENKKKILNYTMDYNLTYLCSNKFFFHFSHPLPSLSLMKDFLVGDLEKNTIYISTVGPNIKDLRAIHVITSPVSIAYYIQRSYTLNGHRSSQIFIYEK